jgi:hypothetical protein
MPWIIGISQPTVALIRNVGHMVLFLVNVLAWAVSGLTRLSNNCISSALGPRLLWSSEIPEVFPISDWVAMLEHGKIIAMAPSKEFLNTKYPAGREFIFVKEQPVVRWCMRGPTTW